MDVFSTSSNVNYQLAKKQLDSVALRQKALSANIANSQTPHYKRQDVDVNFETHLASLIEQGAIDEFEKATPQIKIDSQRSANTHGNNVELDRELLYMQENNIRYQFLLKVTDEILKTTKNAITGNSFQG